MDHLTLKCSLNGHLFYLGIFLLSFVALTKGTFFIQARKLLRTYFPSSFHSFTPLKLYLIFGLLLYNLPLFCVLLFLISIIVNAVVVGNLDPVDRLNPDISLCK